MTDFNGISPSMLQNSSSLDKKSAVSASLETKANVTQSSDNLSFEPDTLVKVDKEADTLPSSLRSNNNEDKSPIEQQQLDDMMEGLNAKLENLKNYLRFEKDEDTEKMVIFIKNSETGEVIRQIPSSEFLEISKNITQFFEARQQLSDKIAMPTGLLADAKA